MVILSLYTHFSPDRHLSAELAAQAVSNAQTVGLHLQNPPARSEDPAYLTRLFCCVWAMDQLNAAFHGRPVMIHERDLGRDMVECIREQDSCFRLFLEIVVLLGCIIDLYRPAAKNTGCVVMEDFPSFDNLVERAQALGVESRLLGISNVDDGNCPPNNESMPVFDPSLFEGPAGFDVFEFFDPGDLNAIDAILGGDAPPGIGPMGSFI
ncbi:uncharacterized protein N0V96_004275 [Colletotrichum fioriniae]|uniref:uncharacterized protein n=1 Tax=Colletotrichum fioriniae TaxID=710243 RepID=UPI0032D9F249|nr:hypothetical protein N0V96_004275 [Colletotrichum fioriniae]